MRSRNTLPASGRGLNCAFDPAGDARNPSRTTDREKFSFARSDFASLLRVMVAQAKAIKAAPCTRNDLLDLSARITKVRDRLRGRHAEIPEPPLTLATTHRMLDPSTPSSRTAACLELRLSIGALDEEPPAFFQ